MKNNKGLAAILATIIIVLLTIVLFAIVAVVVRNTVTKNAEQTILNSQCLDVQIHATKIHATTIQDYNNALGETSGYITNDTEGIDVSLEIFNTALYQNYPLPGWYQITLSRSSAGDPIDGVRLILTDPNDQSINNDLPGKINVLDKSSSIMSFDLITVPNGFGVTADRSAYTPLKVTVVPYFLTKSGDKFYCSEANQYTDTLTLS